MPTLHDFALFLHIAAAIHLLGNAFVSPAILRRVRSATTRGEMLPWLDFFARLARGNPPSALLLLATGVYLGSSGWWSAGWFFVSVFAWVVSSVLAAGVVKPSAARLARAASAAPEAPIGRDLEELRHARGWSLAENAMLGSDIAILWIMVAKPELVASIAIYAGLIALVLVARLAFARGGEEPTALQRTA